MKGNTGPKNLGFVCLFLSVEGFYFSVGRGEDGMNIFYRNMPFVRKLCYFKKMQLNSREKNRLCTYAALIIKIQHLFNENFI